MCSRENAPVIAFPNPQKTGKMSYLEQAKLLDFPLIDPPTAPREASAWDDIAETVEAIVNGFVPDEFKDENGGTIIFNTSKEAVGKISRVGQIVKKKCLGIGKTIIEHEIKLIPTSVWRKMADRVETNIVKPTMPEYAKGFDEAVLKIAKDPENLIVFISSHEGLGDGAGSAKIAKYTTDLINTQRPPENQSEGWMLPISASLGSGHQGVSWQKLIEPLKERALKYHLFMVDITRKKDEEQYSLRGGNRKHSRELIKIINHDNDRIADGQFLYLAGKMEEGRREKRKFPRNLNPFGRPINGLRELNCKSFHSIVNSIELKYHRRVIIIPVGSYGAFDIFDPEHHSLPTLKAIKEFVRPNPKSLLTVKVGLPVSYDDIVLEARKKAKQKNGSEKITSEAIDHKFGDMLAELLPEKARGRYEGYTVDLQ